MLTTVTTADTVTGLGVTVSNAVCMTVLIETPGVECTKLEVGVLTAEIVVLLEVALLPWSIHSVTVITGRSYLVFVELCVLEDVGNLQWASVLLSLSRRSTHSPYSRARL